MYESLQKTGLGDTFDFFILSDSNEVNNWVAEEKAWLELCRQTQGFGRIFYRKRRVPQHHKSGNVADFCRRWGAKYRYMIVLDADSVMTGSAFVRLVGLMERNPRVGIIQTNPQLVLGETLYQRFQQFIARVYRPMFTAGANFWQLGNGNFWGHNAIVRLRPFIEHCAMPELPRTTALGTRILSHDTIEAALMRRAGYTVWLAYDLEGSYEESPPHLPAAMDRDRRWCYGNMQHLWFLFARDLRAASRVHILNGIMAYVTSPLWLLSLILSTLVVIYAPHLTGEPATAVDANAVKSKFLLLLVVGLLFLPKALGTILFLRLRETVRACGGGSRVILGALAETIFSVMLAPILMFSYTRFVWAALTGNKARWTRQKREAHEGLSWDELSAAHLPQTCVALAWAGILVWLAPSLLPWMSLVFFGPIVAIPFSAMTASKRLGLWLRAKGWLLVPEETQPPLELQKIAEPFIVPAGPFFRSKEYATDYGLLQVILDPYINAMHVSLVHQRPQVSVRIREYLNSLSDRLLLDGPFALTPREKRALLWDADSVKRAHQKLWSRPASHLHEWWQAAFRHYNAAMERSVRLNVSAV
jgi:membrane glycosyltransferase